MNIEEIRVISILSPDGEGEVDRLLKCGWVYLNSFSSARIANPRSGMGMMRIGDDIMIVLGKLVK